MDRRKPSMVKILIVSEAFFLALLLLFGIGAIYRVSRQEELGTAKERQALVAHEAVRMKEELAACENVLWELLNKQSEENDLMSPDSSRRYFAKMELREECRDICRYNPKLDYVFSGSGGTYYVSYKGNNSMLSFPVSEWVTEQADMAFSGVPVSSWIIRTFDETEYLTFILTGGGHYCGCLLSVKRFDSRLSGAGAGEECWQLSDSLGNRTGAGTGGFPETSAVSEVLENGLTLKAVFTDQGSFPGRLPMTLVLLWLLCLAAFILQTVLVYRGSAKPLYRLSKQLRELGDDMQAGQELPEIIADAGTDEVYTLQTSIRHLLDEAVLSRMREYEHQLEHQDMELLMMRSQLRPHFYLNALTTIDAMTYQGREEDIRRFLQALSVHVRYMLRTDESGITLGEELRHIEAYLDMQGIRYPNRIFHVISVPDALSGRVIPHLLIYTIVENCFKYALGVEDTLFLMIEAKPLEDGGFTVCVEDNGNGYPEDVIAMINSEKLPEMTPEEKRHIGLRNVRRTMELMYGKQGRIFLENISDTAGGAVRGARTILTFGSE